MRNFPLKYAQIFEAAHKDREAEIMENVYKNSFPSRYLASFMPFVRENLDNEFVFKLAFDGFDAMFTNCLSKYENYQNVPVGFVGSVAYYLKPALDKVAEKHGVTLGKIIRNPLRRP